MRALLLTPHADDESLFAAYTCIRLKPLVVCVFDEGRARELQSAVKHFGCKARQLPIPKGSGEVLVTVALREIALAEYDEVWVPAWEEEGHEEHNLVANCAADVWNGHLLRYYLTYAPRGQRSTWGNRVDPNSPIWLSYKLRALSMYHSQMEDPRSQPWFYDLLDVREWVA